MMGLFEQLIRVKNRIAYVTTSYFGTEIANGKEIITTSATINTSGMRTITLLADKNNTANVNIGNFPLEPGASLSLSFSDVKTIELSTMGSNEIIYWVGVK